MKDALHKTEPPALPPAAGAARSASAREVGRLICLIFALSVPIAGQAADPSAVVPANHFAAESADSKSDRPDQNKSAVESKVPGLERALKSQTQKLPWAPEAAAPLLTLRNHDGLLLAMALLFGVVLISRKIVGLPDGRFRPCGLSPDAAADSLSKVHTEEEALAEFLLSFKSVATGRPDGSPSVATSPAERAPVKKLYARAPGILGALRKLLQKISATTDETARRTLLTDFCRELRILKDTAGLPELLPVWQMTAALEGLVKQLTDKAGYVTPSTMRTVAGAVDFLKELCVPGLRADLFTNPPIRLLAVDDDPICRKVVAFALKKALNQPDLAENGETALALATKQAYDVIFLDVEMPGVDGFELCKRIHETIPNATTPVVFVTICSDFDGRAKSILSGGSNLIAKPFLTFEITVKALTYARRGAAASSLPDPRCLQPGRNGSTAHSPDLARTSPAQNCLPEASEVLVTGTLPEMLANGRCEGELLIASASVR